MCRRHYTANGVPGTALAGGILRVCAAVLLALGSAGCTGAGEFRAFEGRVSWFAKGTGTAPQLVSHAVVHGVVGPDYLRIEQAAGEERTGRIFACARGEYWEYTRDAAGRWSCRMCLLQEHLWRLRCRAEEARGNARGALAHLSALTRQNLWPLFAGTGRAIEPLSDREEIHGAASRKVRAGVYPGVVWEVWLSGEFPLSAAQAELLLVALDLPRAQARDFVERVGEVPVEIDAFSADGKSHVRYAFGGKPAAAASESVDDVIPSEWLAAMAAREERFADERLLLGRAIGGTGSEDGVSVLAACVRACEGLDARRVQFLMRRVASIGDPPARRYVMEAALRASPRHAIAPLWQLLERGDFEVAMDAAQALSAHLPPPENVRALGVVLRRGVREGRAAAFGLRMNDCLQITTGTDVGYWPGPNAERTLERWLDIVKAATAR